MATIVQLPRLSDTMEEGVIAKWHIKPGDKVKRGQLIAEIETDKATMEFESFDAGVVLELVATEGQTLKIGSPIAVFGQPGEDPKAATAGASKPAPAKPAAAEAGAPKSAAASDAAPAEASDEGDDDEGEDAAEVEANAEAGASREADAPKTAAPKAAAPRAPVPKAATTTGEAPRRASDERIAASPLARRLAREHGVELGSIQGSGPRGRIIKDDVERAAAASARPAASAPAAKGDTVLELSQMRKAIARRMSQANAEIPHFYLTIAIDMDRVAAMREELAAAEIKVSYNDFVILACAKALRAHPEINAYWNGQTIVRRGDVHVGIAVALDEGLVVPVVRHADTLSLSKIAETARDLGTRARARTLEVSALSGSTFSISNLGMFGIEAFAAVVNPGEGAILAVGGIADEAVVKDGQLAIGKRMRVTLSCDHRVMDGATGAKFLATLRGMIEHPVRLLA